jgi:hypothetical protein
MVHGENALKSKTTTFRRVQHIVIVAALIAPLLSLVSAPAQAVAPTCAQGGVCTVGDTGPGGGKVFYVAPGNDTFACGPDLAARCRYLEAAPSGWSGNSDDPDMTWSSPSNRTTAVTGADETAVGSGYKNSEDIKNQSGNLAASSAAVTARAYSGGGKSDWYLPSKDELNQMCKWVRGQAWVSDATLCNGTGNMNSGAGAAGFTGVYWSSTEVSADKALSINFLIGYTDFTNVGSQKGFFSWQIRPIRAFSPASLTCAQGGVCEVGDTGPGGGIVFYVAPTTFTQIGASGTMCTTNCKYLEAARISIWGDNSSDPAFAWTILANQSSAVTGANGTAIGTGYQNSVDILNQSGAVIASSTAATAARAFSGGSKSDWYLPSIEEMAAMVPHVALLQLSTSNAYWSSSEDASQAGDANFAYFGTGLALTKAKSNVYLVRTIRAFAPSVDSLVITRASVGTQRGTAFTTQPQITLRNFAGETATASSAVVTATISAGGTLIGTTTATASSGIATFTNLGVNGTVGSRYTITYSATGLVPTSATIALSGTTCDGATFTCQVGDTGPGGGIVFYVAPTTFTQPGATISMCSTWCKYLEAAPSTWFSSSGDPRRTWAGSDYQTLRVFFNGIYPVLGTDGFSIGAGYQNSEFLRATAGNTAANTAAVAARAYTGGGKSDWYLPSKDELNQLYINRVIAGASDGYWSSSEINETTAWDQGFDDGAQGAGTKTTTTPVRPIRAFGTAPTTISIANVVIPAPVTGATPVSSIASNGQYTTAITWSGSPSIFDSSTAYTATVTVTPVAGYTLTGTSTNLFTVNGNSPTSVVSPITSSVLGTTGLDPYAIAVDSIGNVYTTNQKTNTVTKITPLGVSTILGNTGGFPVGIAVDSIGNVYTANLAANTVTKITPDGTSSPFGVTDSTTAAIAIDRVGNIYVANNVSNRVTKITPDGTSTILGATGRNPFSIAVDSIGNVYTANLDANTVTKITPDGTSTTLGTTGRNPFDIAVDSIGNVYTANAADDTVTKFTVTPQGVTSSTFVTSGGFPWGIAVDSIGNIYTANMTWGTARAKVTKITPQGVASNLLTYPDFVPMAVTVDSIGNVYTLDSFNRVIKLSPTNSGVFTYRFPATAAPTAAPVVVAVAPTPVPYLKTLTAPKLRLSAGKLLCTPGTYNAGYTIDGVVQGSATALFTPSSFRYNLLINGVTQTSLAVTSSSTSQSWNMPTGSTGALVTCSVTVTANGITNTDKSGDNSSGASSALTTQSAAIATANATYAAALAANTKAYQKAIVDNRTQWRSTTEKIRTDYYAERDRIRSLPSTKATRALSSAALKAYTAALKKSAADYKASGPAALSAKDAADKAALTARESAFTKANAAYGTAIESIGYGVLIP